MAGHNKWKQIKEKKGKTDEKRGRDFSKILRMIAVQARTEKNPDFNPSLRAAIERAREINVPQENIERAIQKAVGEGVILEELTAEAYGPGGAALIIQAVTDNKNRTIQEIKNILRDNGGRLADPKSVIWAFTNASGEWQAKFPGTFSEGDRSRTLKLIEKLEKDEDVQNVYHNIG